jgi:hypothetical protein
MAERVPATSCRNTLCKGLERRLVLIEFTYCSSKYIRCCGLKVEGKADNGPVRVDVQFCTAFLVVEEPFPISDQEVQGLRTDVEPISNTGLGVPLHVHIVYIEAAVVSFEKDIPAFIEIRTGSKTNNRFDSDNRIAEMPRRQLRAGPQ